MKLLACLSAIAGTFFFAAAQSVTYQNLTSTNVRVDSGQFGPAVEEVHYYYDQWPIGLAVSKTGRIFACYTRGSYVRQQFYFTVRKLISNSLTRSARSRTGLQKLHIPI